MTWHTLNPPLLLADTTTARAYHGPSRSSRRNFVDTLPARVGIQVELEDGTRLLFGDCLVEGDVPAPEDQHGLHVGWSAVVGNKLVVKYRDLLAEEGGLRAPE